MDWKHITTFSGEDFTPLAPDAKQIHIKDIAHALSQMCRANGHFVRFFSVAQHSINCFNEANARGLSAKVQLACLLHDASEAYISDVTRPVKQHLSEYQRIEKQLQNTIFNKFLESPLSENENAQVKQIDDEMMIYEFDALMAKEVFTDLPAIKSKPSFEFSGFLEVEHEFIRKYNELTNQLISVEKEI